mmetsp:Transcript_16794/g.41234  ORF Transcript_16794/g.41234 Transcript_16794/m.41234 type:complete len:103 (+) Transcript_16794:135-443(+)
MLGRGDARAGCDGARDRPFSDQNGDPAPTEKKKKQLFAARVAFFRSSSPPAASAVGQQLSGGDGTFAPPLLSEFHGKLPDVFRVEVLLRLSPTQRALLARVG